MQDESPYHVYQDAHGQWTPAPRRHKDTSASGIGVELFVGLGFIIVAMLFITTGLADSRTYTAETTGIVIAVNQHESCDSDNGCTIVGNPIVEYTVDGRTVKGHTSISSSHWNADDVGKQVKVKYDPSNPTEFEEAGDSFTMFVATGLFPLAFVVAGAVIVFHAGRDIRSRIAGHRDTRPQAQTPLDGYVQTDEYVPATSSGTVPEQTPIQFR
ncbi:MAG: DUF3592 domain-containing protein [Bifidobacteriaceae bacterium]|nr:DUF3592 domain-containing protein [Bifidobacteriaceae bacterium]